MLIDPTIERGWIERTVLSPDSVEPDAKHRDRIRAFGALPERDGRVLRIEDVAIGTTGYAGAGGMQLSRSAERVRAACDFLVDEFPGLATLNLSKKSGWAEVRLADRRKPR